MWLLRFLSSLEKHRAILFSFFIFLLISNEAMAQEKEIDPLLRQPWFADQDKKEELLHNRLQGAFRLSEHYVWKTDSRSRNYRFYKDGHVEMILDRQYKEVFPSRSELDLHYSEAEGLQKHGNPYSAIRLLKGSMYCYRLRYGKLVPEAFEKTAKLLGKFLSQYSHKEKELQRLTDPFGCWDPSVLKIKSNDFAYSFDLSSDFAYLFPDQDKEYSGEDPDFLWQVHRFHKSFPVENEPDTWEKEYRKSSEGLLFFRPDRIVFTIGTTLHYHPQAFDAQSYYKIWDSLRGINQRTMRELNYLRKKEGDSYRTDFDYVSPDGRKSKIVVLERFYLRGGRGMLFSLAYPLRLESEAAKIWSRFSSSVVVE
ncbi:hypothetical protein EHO59_08100 [Leptospira semungkisensis]|uniref:Uncharacterized protein n=1 Tax=Leptospira semungkisensis TaxID=2484985 RepID=A0A4V3JC79_9LEPT|nr:hypothetical protein [Leptospira semungkisensis]TGK04809.1 hypothetical protein EHO59_08100 [Leptospira semungkisensis]